ncbi:hypothetical protein FB451DRAFT_1185977 [Mycena latifolia]|nr:hypothetical protein FB451DRAFT_1185977 [Mycena latifolia]
MNNVIDCERKNTSWSKQVASEDLLPTQAARQDVNLAEWPSVTASCQPIPGDQPASTGKDCRPPRSSMSEIPGRNVTGGKSAPQWPTRILIQGQYAAAIVPTDSAPQAKHKLAARPTHTDVPKHRRNIIIRPVSTHHHIPSILHPRKIQKSQYAAQQYKQDILQRTPYIRRGDSLRREWKIGTRTRIDGIVWDRVRVRDEREGTEREGMGINKRRSRPALATESCVPAVREPTDQQCAARRQKQNKNSGQAVGKKGKNKWKEGRTQRKREHARGQAHSTFITSSATRKVAHRTAPSEVSFAHRSRQLGCSRQREIDRREKSAPLCDDHLRAAGPLSVDQNFLARGGKEKHALDEFSRHRYAGGRGVQMAPVRVRRDLERLRLVSRLLRARFARSMLRQEGVRLRSSRAPRAPAALAVVHLVREQQDSERHQDIGMGREGITQSRGLAHRHPHARVRALHSARQLVVTRSAPQQSLLTSSACTTRAPREVPRQRARAHRVEAARRAPRWEARAFGTGAGVHVVTHVRRARAHGGEPQRAEHLIEECEHAREAVGVVPRVRGGLVQSEYLRGLTNSWGKKESRVQTHQYRLGQRRVAPCALKPVLRSVPQERGAAWAARNAGPPRAGRTTTREDEAEASCLDAAGRGSLSEASARRAYAAPGALGSGGYLAKTWA